mgnify:CR=1 FL=1
MSPSPRRSSPMLAVSAIAIGLLAIGGSSRLTANTSVLPPGALAPSARERMIARQVGSLLEDAHYSRLKIDDSISPRVMDKFLNGMDGQRSYFLASDIAEFEAYRLRFDDMIRTGSSLIQAASAYRGAGATSVHAVATHLVLPNDAVERILGSGLIDTINGTNSHPNSAKIGPRGRVVSVAELLTRAIKRS